MTKDEFIGYCKDKYETMPDYPFEEDFETAVKKLKTMLDSGVITESEFAVEKKKLLKNLY